MFFLEVDLPQDLVHLVQSAPSGSLDSDDFIKILSILRVGGGSDPYLMYQVCYAFQALQYAPDDETLLKAVLRHSAEVVGGLAKASAVLQLDLGVVLEGLDKLHKSLGSVVDTVVTL